MKIYSRFCSFIIILLLVCLMHVCVNQNYFIGFVRNKKSAAEQFIDLQNRLNMLLKFEEHRSTVEQFFERREILNTFKDHQDIVEQFYKPRMTWFTSNLGTYLFKNFDHTKIEQMSKENIIFNVMIWKHWQWLRYRHSKSTISKIYPLHKCNVDNCRFSDDPDFDSADAVVVHIQHGLIPRVKRRDPRQIWIFLTDESPRNTFFSPKKPRLSQLAYIFNWSMTYRTDSDVPVPYGRTVPLPYPKLLDITNDKLLDLVPHWNKKQFDVLAAILISNCEKPRMMFLKDLMRYINVDIHGKCSKKNYTKSSCPGHVYRDCKIVSKYLFYLVLENSKCRQYLSEKGFHNAYGKGAIPVIMGPPVEDCNNLLPPNSFLHVDQFETVKDLALEMIAISTNVTRYLSYHAWRNNFEVINEHGFFETQSFHLCRICQALNYNDGSRKVYDADDIRLFLDPRLLCN